MQIFQYLKDWLRPGETSFNNDANESLASSFVSLSRLLEQEDPEVERLVANLLTLHTELAAKTDLRPSEEVNVLFGGLMGLCTQTVSGRVANKVCNCLRSQNHRRANRKKVMSNPQLLSILPSLRHICAEAEGHLESHWADIISGAENESQHEEAGMSLSLISQSSADHIVYDRLLKFPYFSNYTDLTRLELAAIHAIYPSPIRKIAFIGSGPLPLTSLQLLHTLSPNVEILNIDHDSAAISQSSRLRDKLGSKGEGMRCVQKQVLVT
jgi:nicotianamine synthase